jgi:hypothetical protein
MGLMQAATGGTPYATIGSFNAEKLASTKATTLTLEE